MHSRCNPRSGPLLSKWKAHSMSHAAWLALTALSLSSSSLALASPAQVGQAKIDWADRDDPAHAKARIERASLDGSNRQVLYDASVGVRGPVGLALDTTQGMIYWTEEESLPGNAGQCSPLYTAVRCARMDGSSPPIQLLLVAPPSGPPRFSYDIEIDVLANGLEIQAGTSPDVEGVDNTVSPAGTGPGAIAPGDVLNFQFWYRDPREPPAGFDLSDGLTLCFEQ